MRFLISLGMRAAIVATLGFSAAAAEQLVQIDFRLDDLNAEQQASLWKDLRKMAVFEASLNVCGMRTQVEERITREAGKCVDAESLDMVLAEWRKRLRIEYEDADRDVKTHGGGVENFCTNPQVQTLVTDYVSYVDDLVERAVQLCRLCRTIGRCN